MLVAMEVAVPVTVRSPRSRTLSIVLALRGIKRVQNNAILIPRSITRCFKTNKTTRKKNTRPAMMRSLSIRSAFSRAVTSCFEVMRMLSKVSWVFDVDRSVAVEASVVGSQGRVRGWTRLVVRTEHLCRQNRTLQFALHEINCSSKCLCDVVVRFHEGVLAGGNIQFIEP